MLQPILINGQWCQAHASESFQAFNPATGQKLEQTFPVSRWNDLDRILDAAALAFVALGQQRPDVRAGFLDELASRIEADADGICELAASETGLPVAPRLKSVELPRTANQLRQAAAAARDGCWALPTIDTKLNIRSHLAPLGPVWCLGPNNFPLAYNGICGGDFASAIGAGNPVIVKSHPSHPGTTLRIAQLAVDAAHIAGLPPGAIQLFHHCSVADGLRMAADNRLGAIGFTGGRHAGLSLKKVADEVGKPVFLEMSSINPVVLLPGALIERNAELAEQFCVSCLMAGGQFCTNPGLVLLVEGPEADAFLDAVKRRFSTAPPETLLNAGVRDGMVAGIGKLVAAGATLLAGGKVVEGPRMAVLPTMLQTSASRFLADAAAFQTEVFGASALFVVARNVAELVQLIGKLEGSLTGSVYRSQSTADDSACHSVMAALRPKVGRLLQDKMPTGVALTAAMNHGGPFPATGHPGFTAVGFPASMRRFAALHCYDNVRADSLPEDLRDGGVSPGSWRLVDNVWRQGPITSGSSA